MKLTGNSYQEFNSSTKFFLESKVSADFIPSKLSWPTDSTFDSDASTEPESNSGSAYVNKKKTEMCRNWETKGSCSWGVKCSYAHGYDELQKKNHVPKNYLTRSCFTYHKQGICSFGKRCQFMHSDRDVYSQQSYTTVLRENGRLAKAKTCALDDDLNSQIYINVFAKKTRLRCFAALADEDEHSDEARTFPTMVTPKVNSKKKTGKGSHKKKMILVS